MSARDDYPAMAILHDAWAVSGKKQPEAVRALIEIDQLRAEIASHEAEAEFLRGRVTDLAARLTDCDSTASEVTP